MWVIEFLDAKLLVIPKNPSKNKWKDRIWVQEVQVFNNAEKVQLKKNKKDQ